MAKKEKYLKIIFFNFFCFRRTCCIFYWAFILEFYDPLIIMNYPEIQNKVLKFQDSFNNIGIILVVIGGFSPFPYKITCLGSGILGLNIYLFFISSLASRWLRFFMVGYFFYKFNNEAKKFVYKYINIISLFIIFCLVIYIVYFKN